MEKRPVRAEGPRCQLTTPREANPPRWPSKKPEGGISSIEVYLS